MAQPLITLWHGTTTGAGDQRLRAIAEHGLTKIFNDPRRCGQSQGVYFSATRDYAIARALRCHGKLQRGGAPVLMGIQTDLDPREWDWDYEVSAEPVRAVLAQAGVKANKIIGTNDYSHADYRFQVRNCENIITHLRAQGETQYLMPLFHTMARAIMAEPGRTAAFKYTGKTPLRVQTVEFI